MFHGADRSAIAARWHETVSQQEAAAACQQQVFVDICNGCCLRSLNRGGRIQAAPGSRRTPTTRGGHSDRPPDIREAEVQRVCLAFADLSKALDHKTRQDMITRSGRKALGCLVSQRPSLMINSNDCLSQKHDSRQD